MGIEKDSVNVVFNKIDKLNESMVFLSGLEFCNITVPNFIINNISNYIAECVVVIVHNTVYKEKLQLNYEQRLNTSISKSLNKVTLNNQIISNDNQSNSDLSYIGSKRRYIYEKDKNESVKQLKLYTTNKVRFVNVLEFLIHIQEETKDLTSHYVILDCAFLNRDNTLKYVLFSLRNCCTSCIINYDGQVEVNYILSMIQSLKKDSLFIYTIHVDDPILNFHYVNKTKKLFKTSYTKIETLKEVVIIEDLIKKLAKKSIETMSSQSVYLSFQRLLYLLKTRDPFFFLSEIHIDFELNRGWTKFQSANLIYKLAKLAAVESIKIWKKIKDQLASENTIVFSSRGFSVENYKNIKIDLLDNSVNKKEIQQFMEWFKSSVKALFFKFEEYSREDIEVLDLSKLRNIVFIFPQYKDITSLRLFILELFDFNGWEGNQINIFILTNDVEQLVSQKNRNAELFTNYEKKVKQIVDSNYIEKQIEAAHLIDSLQMKLSYIISSNEVPLKHYLKKFSQNNSVASRMSALQEIGFDVSKPWVPQLKALYTILIDAREMRSSLPLTLSQSLFNNTIQVLKHGDYVLSSAIVVERKSFGDFYTSLATHRVYKQLKNMNNMYEHPILLLELHDKKSVTVMPELVQIKFSYHKVSNLYSLSDLHTKNLFSLLLQQSKFGGRNANFEYSIKEREFDKPELLNIVNVINLLSDDFTKTIRETKTLREYVNSCQSHSILDYKFENLSLYT